jgi:hypothetical protein
MLFTIPEPLLAELRVWRAGRPRDPVEKEHDAFCLDPGLGPAWFLTSDGRVLVDGTCWDGEPLREATDAEACQTIVVGARKLGMAGLIALLPARPQMSRTCGRCDGERYASVLPGCAEAPRFICQECNGLGWTA